MGQTQQEIVLLPAHGAEGTRGRRQKVPRTRCPSLGVLPQEMLAITHRCLAKGLTHGHSEAPSDSMPSPVLPGAGRWDAMQLCVLPAEQRRHWPQPRARELGEFRGILHQAAVGSNWVSCKAVTLRREEVRDEMLRKAFACSYVCGMGSQKQHF